MQPIKLHLCMHAWPTDNLYAAQKPQSGRVCLSGCCLFTILAILCNTAPMAAQGLANF